MRRRSQASTRSGCVKRGATPPIFTDGAPTSTHQRQHQRGGFVAQADLIIRNATIVDGTDRPSFRGDLAVVDGRISQIGRVPGRGSDEIDGAGAILAPGFIDIHTHFDPQLCWDGYATPSLEHGVTTVLIGNCSLSLAPIKPEGRAKIVNMFA